jgi:uncharacterized phage protein gp47/JayE
MANVFVATSDIVQEMVDDYKSITGITLDPNNFDDSYVAKFWAEAGAVSSMYAQVQRVLNDFFPATASTEALVQHLSTRAMPGQIQPQPSSGQIKLTGNAAGIAVAAGTQVKRVSDGAVFTAIQDGVTGSDFTVILFFQSASTGNVQNLDSYNQPFTLTTAIAGMKTACVNSSLFLDGRDLETDAEMRARIQAHDQDDNSGGNQTAYETWATIASNQVVTAKTIRLPRGADTVDTYITAGTSDIAAAVQAGQPVTRLPSADLLATVQAYILARNPVTDDHLTKAPIEIPFDVNFAYDLFTETASNRTYVNGIITKVIQTYIYQARPLDVITSTAIERLVDQAIGDQISERHCADLGGSVGHYQVPAINILTPRTITLLTL